jgi:endonuclease YncB( thermonuclease family)
VISYGRWPASTERQELNFYAMVRPWFVVGKQPQQMTFQMLTSQYGLRRLVYLLLPLTLSFPVAAANLVGQISVVDGDTLDIHDDRIRLWGIDAPESAQLCRDRDRRAYRCGAQAANALYNFTKGKTVRCMPMDRDQYDRIVAHCTAGGTDLGQMLVSRGLALEAPRYSHGRYAADQATAKRAGRGLWAGRFVAPSVYRACMQSGGRPADCSGIPRKRR